MKTGKKRSLWRRLKVLALILCGAFVALVAGLVTITFSDLTGPVAEPPHSFEEAVEAVLDKSVGYGTVRAADSALATSVAAPAEKPSPEEVTAPDVAFDERLIERMRPVQDVSALPDHLQPAGRKWNAAEDDITSAMLALVRQARLTDWVDADTRLRDLYWRHRELEKEYDAIFFENGKRPIIITEGTWEADLSEHDRHWFTVYNEASIAIRVEHGEWIEAGNRCIRYSLPEDWEREKSYYRKAGLKGAGMIAIRSVVLWYEVNVEPTWEKVLNPPNTPGLPPGHR